MSNEIIDTGDCIIKKFYSPQIHLDNKWFKLYKEFYTLFGNVPEIIECSPYSIAMEKIDGITLHEWLYEGENQPTPHQVMQITEQVLEACHSFVSFSVLKHTPFMHLDMHPRNIILRPDDTICFIDPDSIEIDFKEFNNIGEFFINLSSAYTRIRCTTKRVKYE